MHKRLKVKLYPNKEQKKMLETHFDGYRYAYNLCLAYKKELWSGWKKNISKYDMQKELFDLRKEVPWLKVCKAECIRDAALNVDKAYKNFFKGRGYPKFKNKKDLQSFSAYQTIRCKDSKLSFFRNKIKFKTSEKHNNILETHKIKQCTFKKDSCGDYWATFLIETEDTRKLPKSESVIGVDLGIKHLIITSDGEYFENKRFMQKQKYKLRHFQRKFAKTKKCGKNREKLRIKINKIYRKITRQREHYYHQITNQLIRENQTIIMESLKVQQMNKNKNLAYSIQDVSWGLLTQMLEYKCKWYGRELIKIDQYFPSSKTCSNCGNIKNMLLLSERVFNCTECKISIDRDLNASLNIKQAGTKMPEETVEEKDISPPMKQ